MWIPLGISRAVFGKADGPSSRKLEETGDARARTAGQMDSNACRNAVLPPRARRRRSGTVHRFAMRSTVGLRLQLLLSAPVSAAPSL